MIISNLNNFLSLLVVVVFVKYVVEVVRFGVCVGRVACGVCGGF